MIDSVLMRSIVCWPDMLVCTYLAFCALRIFDSARNRKWKWEGGRERRLEIGGRDRKEIERWSAKRIFTLQRNQSAHRLMIAIIAIIRTKRERLLTFKRLIRLIGLSIDDCVSCTPEITCTKSWQDLWRYYS